MCVLRVSLLLGLCACVFACTPSSSSTSSTSSSGNAELPDSGAGVDAAQPLPDAAVPDAAGPPDASIALDAGAPTDAGVPLDAARPLPDAASVDAANTESCADGVDNDGDLAADCRDADCESAPLCALSEDTTAACSDDVDNDGDTYVDCSDRDCEGVAPCGAAERDVSACVDSVDNDLDGYTDCVDFGCRGLSVCLPYEDRAPGCTDGVDNDMDGQRDCMDPGCMGLSVCQTSESDLATCTDGVDNDQDMLRDCADPGCLPLAACAVPRLRMATWNVQQLMGGDPPSAQGQAAADAVAAMLARMDADVVCLNEVHDDEDAEVRSLATGLGYPFVFQGLISTPMAGGLTNVCLSRRPFVRARSRSSNDISTDTQANETGRDLVEVAVELVPGGTQVTLVSTHFKSGFDNATLFRRHVEAVRAAQIATAAASSGAAIVMGDFNEEIDGNTTRTFNAPPSGMPSSYRLGSDIAYPVVYAPFSALGAAQLVAVNARHEDSSTDATRIPSGRRIDYIMLRGASVVGAEVYNPCVDNGVDDGAVGGRLEKAGSPVPCATAQAASDHWPVMVDLAP